MRVAILTMIFNNNYGGVLQAFALKKKIEGMGHKVTILEVGSKKLRLIELLFLVLKRGLLKFLFWKRGIGRIFPGDGLSTKEKLLLSQHFRRFVEVYLSPRTELIVREKDFKNKYSVGFDAYVVGSDQVWRPTMYPYIKSAFLNFVEGNSRRISYAPSLGVETWEFSKRQTRMVFNELLRFDAISIREQQGRKLFEQHLGIDATWVLDPTLLLDSEDYDKVASRFQSENDVRFDSLVYFLDNSKDKACLVDKVNDFFGYSSFRIERDYRRLLELKQPFLSVEEWLLRIKTSRFIITDSYHGCIFSIIYNKPFFCYANSERGSSRFTSLLEKLKLLDRLVNNSSEVTECLLNKEIDWNDVNNRLMHMREKSEKFLVQAFG